MFVRMEKFRRTGWLGEGGAAPLSENKGLRVFDGG